MVCQTKFRAPTSSFFLYITAEIIKKHPSAWRASFSVGFRSNMRQMFNIMFSTLTYWVHVLSIIVLFLTSLNILPEWVILILHRTSVSNHNILQLDANAKSQIWSNKINNVLEKLIHRFLDWIGFGFHFSILIVYAKVQLSNTCFYVNRGWTDMEKL